MPKGDKALQFLDLIEGASEDELAEMVHAALGALPKQSAVAACIDWADGTGLIGELNIAVLDRMTEGLLGDAPDLEIRPD